MPYAIDLFCGAGGFSEGILQAGFDIIFSSDKSSMVMETYTNRHMQLGLIEGEDTHFELADINELTSESIFESINNLRYGPIFEQGSVDAIFGGPPCQGFSRLGKRDSNDPRNMLFHEYLRIIRDIRPKYVVMENVTGILDMMMLDFPSVINDEYYSGQNLVTSILEQEFEGLGYTLLDVQTLNAADFGVPQQRNRVVYLAYRNDVAPVTYPEGEENQVTVYDALGDLYLENEYNYSTEFSRGSVRGRTPSVLTGDSISRESILNMDEATHNQIIIERFSLYQQGENKRSSLIRLKRDGIDLRNIAPNLFYESLLQLNSSSIVPFIQDALNNLGIENMVLSDQWLRFTNRLLLSMNQYHQNNDIDSFNACVSTLSKRLTVDNEAAFHFWEQVSGHLTDFLAEDEYNERLQNGAIDDAMAEAIFTKKGIRTRLNSTTISPTMVTLPDDFIHPYFNRILTVREMARLQSFDDSFEFLGKRTTGGSKRASEVPQFTQVGNAVPPLLARAIATQVREAIEANEELQVINTLRRA